MAAEAASVARRTTNNAVPQPPPGPPMWGSRRLPRTFAAFRHGNFRLFYFGQLISLIGSWMQNTAQGWLVVLLASPGVTLAQAATGKHAGSEAQANVYLGMIATAGSLPVLLGALYGGVIADRYPKRTIIILAQAAQGLLALAMTALILYGHIQIWHVVVLAALLGVSNVFDIPARQSFVVEMVGREDLPNAIALNSSIFNAARAFGPAAAGLLIAALHGKSEENALAQCFLWNGLSYIAVIAGLFLMRGDFGVVRSGNDSPIVQVREVLGYLREKRPALLLVGLVAVFSICVAPYFVLMPSFAKFTLDMDARAYGILLSCQGLGALLGALTVATLSENPRKGQILSMAALSFPVLLVLLSFTRSYPTVYALVIATGFMIICFLATANTLLQTSVPDELRGRVMGVYSVILMGLTPVGSLWSTGVARMTSAPMTIAIGALVTGLVMVTAFTRYPRFRRMERMLPEHL